MPKFENTADVVAEPVFIVSFGAGLASSTFGSLFAGAHSNSNWLERIQNHGDLSIGSFDLICREPHF